MNITLRNKIDKHLVMFESYIGKGIAIWGGELYLSNFSCEVELEIDDFFKIGKNIFLEKAKDFSINFIDGFMIFKAKVISYEDDGILALRLRNDIIFINVLEEDTIDGYVSFFTTPDKVTLYPVVL